MKKRTEQILLFRLMTQRTIKHICQVFNVIRYKIRQLAVSAVVPDLLNRIQLRSIGRQPFNINTVKASLQSFSTTAMYHPTIYNKDYTLRKVYEQFSNKIFKVISTNIGILYRKIQSQLPPFRRNANSRYYRQSVAHLPAIMNRCLALWCPCASYSRLQHKAAFIDKYNGFSRPAGFFLYAANHFYARWQWHFYHVLWPFSRVFGNSSPYLSKYARHLNSHKQYRSVFLLLRRLFAMSKVRCDNRSCEHLSKAAFPASACAFDLAPALVLEDYVPQRKLRLVFHRLAAIGLWPKQWHFAAYVPVGQLFLWVSYPYYRHKTVRLFNFSKSNTFIISK